MKFGLVLREGVATMWAAKVPSTLVLLLVAAMCVATIATVGQTAAADQQLQERLDSAGSRVLVVNDGQSGGLISPTIIDQVKGLSTTERAVGTLIPIDVVNGAVGQGATRVPAWGVYGDMPAVATLTAGRWPGPGEALVSDEAMTRLGLDAPLGWVAQASTTATNDFTVVGSFAPREPFATYSAGLLYAAAEDQPLDSLHVVITHSGAAQSTQGQVLSLIAPPTPTDIAVSSPISLADLQAQVTGDLATFGRTLLAAVLGGGGSLVAVVVLADVLVRRKDLGRRRALGATRSTIVALVLVRTLAPAMLGATLGCSLGVALAARIEAVPPWSFTVGTATLAILAAATATVAPALFAAARDPVKVLRTP